MHNYPLLASKQTSARIDFLRQGGRLVDRMATFHVKVLAESWTNGDWAAYTSLGNATGKTRALATASASGCRACSPQPTGTAPWKRRSNRAWSASFQLVGHGLND